MIRRHARELSVAAVYLALLLLMALLRPAFFQHQFRATWVQIAPVLVVAVGMTLVIVARHIDISIGSQFSICAILAGLMAKAALPMPIVALLTLGTGAAMGAVNGALVAFLGLPSIVVTLATMVALQQGLSLAGDGATVNDLPASFQWFGRSQSNGEILLVVSAAVIFGLFAWTLRYVAAGRAVFAVGSDAEAARLAGIRPKRVVFWVFVVMGLLTALGALLQSVRFAEVDPKTGMGMELQTIAAVVVGGTAISGGRGTLFGSLVGVALLVTIGPVLTFLSGHAYWDRAIQGSIILLAVASDSVYASNA